MFADIKVIYDNFLISVPCGTCSGTVPKHLISFYRKKRMNTLRYVYEPQFACPELVRSAITGRLEQILVTMHERSGTVHVCDITTVDALRDSMSYRLRLRYATVQIAYNGQVMENGHMLRDYGVLTGHCITVRYKDILEDKRLKKYVPDICYYESRLCPYTQYERRRDMVRKCLKKLRRALESYSENYDIDIESCLEYDTAHALIELAEIFVFETSFLCETSYRLTNMYHGAAWYMEHLKRNPFLSLY